MSAPNTSSGSDRVRLLADPIRRRICAILSDPDPPIAERDLAAELAARCLDVPAGEITTGDRRQYRIRLRHHQLPKLADYGVIVYNRSTGMVSITPTGWEALDAVGDTPSGATPVSTEAQPVGERT